MKKKSITLRKYICHNKQLQNLYKFMRWVWISKSNIITLSIHETPDSDIFLYFFSIFGLKIRVFDKVCLPNSSVCFSFPSIELV